MRCDLCPGEYLERLTAISLKRDGRTLVIEDVPARVCNLCGDRLYSESTFGRLFTVLEEEPEGAAPLYRFQATTTAR